MDGVLEQARAVAKRKEMSDPNLRYDVSLSSGNDRINGKQYSSPGILALSLEDGKIALGRLPPSHRSACRVGSFAHGMPANVVRQQAGDFDAQSFGVAKRNQDAEPAAQQLLGVPVGCRYDCLAQSETVSERARCHLRFIEIGSRIDVAHRNEVQQCGLIHELVEKNDMVFDAEILHARRQTVAIGLALLPH